MGREADHLHEQEHRDHGSEPGGGVRARVHHHRAAAHAGEEARPPGQATGGTPLSFRRYVTRVISTILYLLCGHFVMLGLSRPVISSSYSPSVSRTLRAISTTCALVLH